VIDQNPGDRRKHTRRTWSGRERRSGEDRRSDSRNISERRQGESYRDYIERIVRAAPPLPDKAQIEIRAAADEYWRDRDREPLCPENLPGRAPGSGG